MPRAYWAGCRRATSGELEDPLGASPSLAGPPARPRPQARKASFLASLASAHMPIGTSQRARRDRSGTPRSAPRELGCTHVSSLTPSRFPFRVSLQHPLVSSLVSRGNSHGNQQQVCLGAPKISQSAAKYLGILRYTWKTPGIPGKIRYFADFLGFAFQILPQTTAECDRTIGSFGHQSGITREQLSLPLLQAFVASYGSSRVSTSGLSASPTLRAP